MLRFSVGVDYEDYCYFHVLDDGERINMNEVVRLLNKLYIRNKSLEEENKRLDTINLTQQEILEAALKENQELKEFNDKLIECNFTELKC